MTSSPRKGRPPLPENLRRKIVKSATTGDRDCSIRKIADRAGVSESSVVRILKREGLYPRKKGRKKRGERKTSSTKTITLEVVAEQAGVSRSTASLALRGSSKVASATRDKIMRVADSLGYKAHPYMGALMAYVRAGRVHPVKAVLGYLYASTFKPDRFAVEYRKQYGPARRFDAAKEAARIRGYELQPFDLYEYGDEGRRQQEILTNRGIRGLLVDVPAYVPQESSFNFASFNCVGFRDTAPVSMDVVATDYVQNMITAYRKLWEKGYRRIGCIKIMSHSFASSDARTAGYLHAQYLMTPRELRLPLIPLDFYPGQLKKHSSGGLSLDETYSAGDSESLAEAWSGVNTRKLKQMSDHELAMTTLEEWVKQYRPDAIIAEHVDLIRWLDRMGYRVPEDISVVHTDLKDDVPGWAGIRRADAQLGKAAVKMVCDQIDLGKTGAPEHPMFQYIRGTWEEGWTVSS